MFLLFTIIEILVLLLHVSFHNKWHTFQVKRCCFAFTAAVAFLMSAINW